MSEEFLPWYCGLSQSKAEADAQALRNEGIRATVELHGQGYCVAVAKADMTKVIELEAKKHSV